MTTPRHRHRVKKHPGLVAMGKRIRELRMARGYAQEAFAIEAGIDRSYYGGIERGERNVAAVNLMLLAKKLEVTVGELFPDVEITLSVPVRKKSRASK